VTTGVIAALVLSRAGVARADAVAALLVMAVIARVAWKILAANTYQENETRKLAVQFLADF